MKRAHDPGTMAAHLRERHLVDHRVGGRQLPTAPMRVWRILAVWPAVRAHIYLDWGRDRISSSAGWHCPVAKRWGTIARLQARDGAGRGGCASAGYPLLQSVPPRPQLSYTVQQQREIVEALIADRENARYTSQVVRHRSGLSSLPPPPPARARAGRRSSQRIAAR